MIVEQENSPPEQQQVTLLPHRVETKNPSVPKNSTLYVHSAIGDTLQKSKLLLLCICLHPM